MSGRGPSWGWSSMHNGKFWDMWNRLAEAEQRIAQLEKQLRELTPPVEEGITLGMKTIFSDYYRAPTDVSTELLNTKST